MNQENLRRGIMAAAAQLPGLELEEEDLNGILAISKLERYSKNRCVFGIGEECVYSGLVLEGLLRSYYLDMEGNEITRNFHKEYSWVADEGLIGYEAHICAYETFEDSAVLLFETKQLKKMIAENDRLKNAYIVMLESGMRYKIYRENEFLTKNATERYLRFKADFPEVADRAKQTCVSTYLGVAPESLSRIRRGLKEII
ncbi:MAG: Crp/Fnr family transcriptional regulator [Lachnospiraceae bacterium]|nr:Crp/Fnr family transcriptional regulator [Lachnospiraceae bacterium]